MICALLATPSIGVAAFEDRAKEFHILSRNIAFIQEKGVGRAVWAGRCVSLNAYNKSGLVDLGVKSHSIHDCADNCWHYNIRLLSNLLEPILIDAHRHVLNGNFIGEQRKAQWIGNLSFMNVNYFFKFAARISLIVSTPNADAKICASTHIFVAGECPKFFKTKRRVKFMPLTL